MKIDTFRFFIFVITLVASVILAVRLELPWYIGLFFVWGVTNFIASFIRTIQEQLDNRK